MGYSPDNPFVGQAGPKRKPPNTRSHLEVPDYPDPPAAEAPSDPAYERQGMFTTAAQLASLDGRGGYSPENPFAKHKAPSYSAENPFAASSESLSNRAAPAWGIPEAAPKDVTATPSMTPPRPTRTVGPKGITTYASPPTTFEQVRDIVMNRSIDHPIAGALTAFTPMGMGAQSSQELRAGHPIQAAATAALALTPAALSGVRALRGARTIAREAAPVGEAASSMKVEMHGRPEAIALEQELAAAGRKPLELPKPKEAPAVEPSSVAREEPTETYWRASSRGKQGGTFNEAGGLYVFRSKRAAEQFASVYPDRVVEPIKLRGGLRRKAVGDMEIELIGSDPNALAAARHDGIDVLENSGDDVGEPGEQALVLNPRAIVRAGTVFSNPVGPALKYAATSRVGSSAALGATGYGLSQSDDEKLKATGTGLMLLAGIHAIGAPRIRAVGRLVGNEVVQGLKSSPMGQRALNLISHDILADPQVKSLVQTYEKGVAMGHARAAEFSKMAKNLGPEQDRRVSDLIEHENFEPLTTDQVVTLGVAQKISDEFTALGKAKVGAGLLSAGTVAKREGKYLPRMYAEHLGEQATADRPTMFGGGKKIRIVGDQRREDLSDVVRNQLGEVREASFRAGRGVEKSYRDLAAAKLFAALREMPDVVHPDYAQASDALSAAIQTGDPQAILQAKRVMAGVSAQFKDGTQGFRKLPDTPGMGVLRGAIVRGDVADYLNGVPDLGGRAGSLLNVWKKVHTVFNLGTHIGNTASNGMIAHTIGLPLWEQPLAIRKALQDWKAYGPATKTLTEAGILSHGIPTQTQAVPLGGRPMKQALSELSATTRPETQKVLAEHGIRPQGPLAKGAKVVANRVLSLGLTSDMAGAYAKEDGIYRVAVWQKLTGQGMAPEKAAELVDKAFVNYKTRSPLLGAIKNTVSPFIMYPVKAIPFVTEQIVEHPWRWAMLSAMWGGLDQYSRHKVGAIAEADLRPSQRTNKYLGYLVPGMTQLPFTNDRGDKYGTDIARWTPFSALTGSPAPGSTAFAALGEDVPGIVQPSGPFVDLGARLTNTDPFTGDKLIKPGADTREKLGVAAKSAAALALPSALSFHAPRVLEDVINADPKAASINALGLVGARPQVVRPGMQQFRERKDYEDARNQIVADLRRDLRASKSDRHSQALEMRARARLESLAGKYQAAVAQR